MPKDEQINNALDEIIIIYRSGGMDAISRWLEGLSAEGKLLAAHGLNRLVLGIMVYLVEFSEDTDTAMSLGSQLGWWLPRLVNVVGEVETDHLSFMVKLLQLVKQNNATTTSE